MKPRFLDSVASIDTSAEPALDLAGLPKLMDRRDAAKLVSEVFFKTSRRTIERWPLPTRLVNGRAQLETRQVIAYARARVAEAPLVMGGGRRKRRE